MAGLLHSSASNLWSRSLSDDDRVLVTGASGWVGSTACALLAATPCEVLPLASTRRAIRIGDATVHCVPWDWTEVRSFRPTVVIDCAFLTRDHVATMPLADYFAINESLTANTLAAVQLDTVQRVVTISSGAAVFPVDALSRPREENPYGWLKRHAERELEFVAKERGISAVIARAWSLSGAFVRHPAHYALFDMITQAIAGAIHIKAVAPVYRRYTSVEDLLAVALSNTDAPGATVIDSGGPLLEMAELAAAVARVVNPGGPITRAQPDGSAPNAYFAEPESWDRACVSAAFVPADIDEQIAVAHQGLRDQRGNNPT